MKRSASLAAGLAIAGVGAFVGIRRRPGKFGAFTMTVRIAPDDARTRWEEDPSRRKDDVAFRAAPGDRGTEVTVANAGHKKIARLREFKQIVEAGAVTVAVARP